MSKSNEEEFGNVILGKRIGSTKAYRCQNCGIILDCIWFSVTGVYSRKKWMNLDFLPRAIEKQ